MLSLTRKSQHAEPGLPMVVGLGVRIRLAEQSWLSLATFVLGFLNQCNQLLGYFLSSSLCFQLYAKPIVGAASIFAPIVE